MKLNEWVEQEPDGAMSRLSQDSRVAYTTVCRVVKKSAEGNADCSIPVARKFRDATGGKVSIAELRLPDDELVRLGLRESAASKRKRSAA